MSHYASETFLHQLLGKALAAGATDIHLKVGKPPGARVGADLVFFRVDEIRAEDTEAAARVLFGFDERVESDVVRAYDARELGRFRVTAFRQRGALSLILRHVPATIAMPPEIGLPAAAVALVERARGLVILAGGPRSGRSTTAAALIAHLNATRPWHILTFEDPIEHLHTDRVGSVAQRAIGFDVPSLAEGLRSASRHDADLLFAADLKSPHELDAALEAAPRALVLATLAAADVPRAVARLSAMSRAIPDGEARLALGLAGVIAQRLVAARDDAPLPQRVAVEVKLATRGVLSEAVHGWPTPSPELARLAFEAG